MATERVILASLSIEAAIAAGSDEDWDLPVCLPGTWELKELYYSPDTADAADATNYAVLTVETFDVIANLAACTGTITNASTAFTIGTARSVALTGAATIVEAGDTIRIAKTEAGTGGAIHGHVCVTAEKVG